MIYDCFTFFNELELLEIRLNILDKKVDKFVLVESTLTHQGKPKPLYYETNKHLFQKFHNKIIHIIVDDMPSYNGNNSWELEHYQRNGILRGLQNCTEKDCVIISDVDEIPNIDNIDFNTIKKNTIYIFRQKMFYYYINCINAFNNKKYRWHGSCLYRYSNKFTPQDIREVSLKVQGLFSPKLIHRLYCNIMKIQQVYLKGWNIKFIEDGGWHFSYLGGIDKVIQKLESFAHTEYNKPEYKNPDKLKELIESGKDIFGRNFEYQFIPLDNTFPEFILQNKDKYAHLIK